MSVDTRTKTTEREIQTIPKGWRYLPFGEGVSVNPKRLIAKNQAVKFITMADIEPFTKSIKGGIVKNFSGGTKFRNGDTLMARITPCLENGKTGFVNFLEEDEVAGGSTEFIVLTGKEGVSDSNFIYYLAINPSVRNIAIQAMTGTSGRQRVENDKLVKHLILLPPINEQRNIAKILSSLDDKIELNRKINENLENIASAIFKKWFVNIGDDLPDGWKMGALGDAITNFDSKRVPLSSREREKRQGSYPYYGATSVMDRVDDFIFEGTYVLLGEDGSVAKEDGKPFVQYVHGKMWVNNHAHVLQGKNGFSTEYIKVFLDQVDIMPFVTGAVQPKLNQANMNSVPMVIPDQETLGKFNEILSALFGMILENENQTNNLEQLRDSLLPRLMSGKIRIDE